MAVCWEAIPNFVLSPHAGTQMVLVQVAQPTDLFLFLVSSLKKELEEQMAIEMSGPTFPCL